MNNKELKKNLEKERKKQREDAIKINTFIRLDKSRASEIDKQIEQNYKIIYLCKRILNLSVPTKT